MNTNTVGTKTRGAIKAANDKVYGLGVAITLIVFLVALFGGQLLAQNKIIVINATTGVAILVALGFIALVVAVIALLNAKLFILRLVAVLMAVASAGLTVAYWKTVGTAFSKAGWPTFFWFMFALVLVTGLACWQNRNSRLVVKTATHDTSVGQPPTA
jgi:hypothetical protein